MKKILTLVFLTTLLYCKKDTTLIPDNTPFQDKYISTIQVESYVNKLFIDLIGREPLNTEMESEVNLLKTNELNEQARIDLITKLQSSTDFLEGDSSYSHAYYHRFYDVLKLKMLEGLENDELKVERGIITNLYNGAVASGDSAKAASRLKDITEITNILNIEKDYKNATVTINEIFIRLMDNYAYDIINMNTFNFVNATFDDVFFRLPTSSEYDIAYEMIENNQSGFLLGQTGTNKGEYLNLIVNSREFHEGLINWAYKSLLVRDPSASEVIKHLNELLATKDFQKLQLDIMKTNEFANF
jgi:hypothetical protein